MHDVQIYRGFRLTFHPELSFAQPPCARGTVEPITLEARAAWGCDPSGKPEALVALQSESARAFYTHAQSTVDAVLRQPAPYQTPAEPLPGRGRLDDALSATPAVARAEIGVDRSKEPLSGT